MTTEVTERAPSPAREQFAGFFREVHGTDPFPWQEGLLDRVLSDGWPALIDVPTGLGKTAILDIAVFASAMGATPARRRIFLVVDRRLIVDQAYEHAARIQRALAAALPGSACHAVAARLAMPGDEDGPVLDVTRMRGGIDWSWLWLERPDRHAIITGTVDQVGSRLLFRGYGVGAQLRPIDAALVGTDSLIIVDEAHLSDPFLTTLSDIAQLAPADPGRAPVVVAMSASPSEDQAGSHRISSADEHHPVAEKRLNAPKRLHLLSVAAARQASRDKVAEAMAQCTTAIGGPGRLTGVIANTVAMARAVFGRLRSELPDPGQCVLLTGRIRPVDREYLLHDWLPRINAGASRDPEQALYVVATQTIEAGADIDLDGMITESAALPALIQRLGRVNRRGERPSADVIVVHSGSLEDRVYGEARLRTWEWLTSLPGALELRTVRQAADLGAGVPVSPAKLRRFVQSAQPGAMEAMRVAPPYAPVVWADTLDAWARTSPVPQPDVPVAPYLHGIEAGEPTASLVWRAALPGDDPRQWADAVETLPPSADEALELPVSVIRRWLASRAGAGDVLLSDAESHASAAAQDEAADADGPVRRALRYGGPDGSEAISPREVRAGDLIIVPAAWGGCDRFGWNPASNSEVTDVADLAAGSRGARAAIRVGPTLLDAMRTYAPDLADPVGQLIRQIGDDLVDDTHNARTYQSMLSVMLATQPASAGTRALLPHQRVLKRLVEANPLTLIVAAADQLTRSRLALLAARDRSAGWSSDASAAGTSASAKPMGLVAHQEVVQARAREFAANLGLPADLIHAVGQAAVHHDEGKRDPRFQLMLHGGDKWQHTAATEALAKSGMDPANRAAFRRARRLSGYPMGMRHEDLSARLAAALLDAEPGRDLIIHLIASHHGYGRPLLPPTVDDAPVDIPGLGTEPTLLSSAETVDWAGPARFGLLCERYGRWGLALLEAIVRLADIWCSARPDELPEESW